MIADIILILLLLFFGYRGLKNGFMKSILSFAGILLSFILALLFTSTLASALDGSAIHNFFLNTSGDMLGSIGEFMSTTIPSYDMLYDSLCIKLPDFLAKILADSASSLFGSSANMTIAELLTPGLTSIFMTLVSFFILFIGSFILIKIIKSLVSAITSLPIINVVDKILGFVFGFIKGFVFISVVLLLLSFLGNISFIETMMVYINDSTLVSYLYNNNFILMIVHAFFG